MGKKRNIQQINAIASPFGRVRPLIDKRWSSQSSTVLVLGILLIYPTRVLRYGSRSLYHH